MASGKCGLPLALARQSSYNAATTPRSLRMSDTLSPIDTAKFAAAKRASAFVESGMKVGLGTGSTAA